MALAASAADSFQAIADPTRRRILDLLIEGERAVMDLVSVFNISQPAISQHLRVLRDCGMVRVRHDGRRRFYRLHPARLKEVADWVAAYERFWTEKLESLGHYLDRKHNPLMEIS